MKNKYLKLLALSLVAFLLSCCGEKTPSTTPSNSNSFQENNSDIIESDSLQESNSVVDFVNREVLENENYMWPFKENSAYRGEIDFSVGSLDYGNLNLKIENQVINKEEKVNYDGKIKYDLSTSHPCHSDTIEHAYNKITFNDVVYGSLPSDDTKGINIPNAELYDGENIFSVTIGKVYVYNQSYDMNQVHGGLDGGGDDFQISNVRLEMPTGEIIKPSKMVVYKPVAADSKKYVTYEMKQIDDEFYWLGDGWGGSLSTDGNSNPRLDIPFRIDYYFDSYTPGGLSTYKLDTNQFDDGKYTVSLYDGETVVLRNNIFFDNNGPKITTNINNYQHINNKFKLETDIVDETSGVNETIIKIDGREINFDSFYLSNLSPGNHNLTIYANDKSLNEVYYYRNFTIMANSDTISLEKDNNHLNIHNLYEAENTLKIYQANELTYTSTTPLNEKQSSSEIPNNIFKINVVDANQDLYLTYNGTSLSGEKIAIEALNPSTNVYERITIANSNIDVNFMISPAKYVKNNQIELKVSPLYVGNGSNRILWSSDTQYLPKAKFTDINYMYNALMEYASNEYKNGKMSYFVHTGDVVDDSPDYGASAIAEYEIATKAFEILDNNKVPYGVSAGNHDVGTALSSINYVNFSNYFGVDRYSSNDHYGGSLNNNECHYDLISIGKYDFIVLYLGFGVEAKKETIQWANNVLKTFKHRNAILATHAYLDADGTIDDLVQGQQIYDEIVVPNENIKFVFCGHTDGNACVKKQVNDNRYVYEILNCYQFVQKKSYAVDHIINGMTCNGEAYIKELIFEDNIVKCHTFSPVVNLTNPLNSNDDFEIQVDLYDSVKELTTTTFKVYQPNGEAIVNQNVTNSYDLSSLPSSKYIVYVNDNCDGYGFELIG